MRGLNFIPGSPIKRRKPPGVAAAAGEAGEASNNTRSKQPHGIFKGSKVDNSATRNTGTDKTTEKSIADIDWHKDINYAMRTGGWEQIRTHLKTVHSLPRPDSTSNLNASVSSLCSSDMSNFHASLGTFSSEDSGGNHSHGNSSSGNSLSNRRNNNGSTKSASSSKTNFWKRLSKKGKTQDNSSQTPYNNNNRTSALSDRTGLLSVDSEGRTPLHLAMTSKRCPREILMQIIALEPRAVAVANSRGRYPLHFAVVHKHDMQVISELIEVFPPALAACDCKDMEPLAYAMDAAKRESNIAQAPRTFWMPAPVGTAEYDWQEEQCEIWSSVHWLLLAAATHPRTRLSLGRGSKTKPMLVDALIHAAPPPVISLLIAASVTLLSHENRATAFAGSTLYSCISRHYPVQILMSLASQCPKDVQTVQDETGMGLVSSQFISGCFQQCSDCEWELCDDFYQKVVQTIDQGVLDEDDDSLLDWWQKIEFLLAFCASGNKWDPTTFPSSQLLFAALRNSDTPPQVIEVLLALYPQSIRLTDQETGAFPLYLAASRREYVPRKYECKAFEKKNILDMILRCDQAAATRKFGQYLPVHGAVSIGRTYSEIKPLVAPHPEVLLKQDPSSGLYPFMQVAVPQNRRDLARWTCVARNKHSFSNWKELSERQKAGAVIKVAEKENLARLGTIYELLRLQPAVIEKLGRSEHVKYRNDEYAVGGVSSHFCSWYYAKSESGKHIPNLDNIQIMRNAMEIVAEDDSLDDLPSEFMEWWHEMKKRIVSAYQLRGKDEWRIPVDDEKFLLHAAISNPDSPPQLVVLLLTLYPRSSSIPLPGVPFLPLHIAARTLSYRPRSFETYQKESFELILNAYPEAAEINAGGYLPLHLALRGCKTWDEIRTLVEMNSDALAERDPKSGFYPFQLVAMKKNYTAIERSWFEQAAKHQFEGQVWDLLSSRERFREMRRCQKSHQAGALSCTYELLRKNASVLPFSLRISSVNSSPFTLEPEQQREDSEYENEDFEDVDNSVTSGSSSVSGRCSYSGSDSCSDSDGDSFSDESSDGLANEPSLYRKSHKNKQENGKKLSLDQLFSKKSRSCDDEDNDDLFECDASVFSNVDVMSTLSMTVHSTLNRHSTRKLNKRVESRNASQRESSSRVLLQKNGSLRELLHKASSSHEVSRRRNGERDLVHRGHSSNRELLRRDGSCREFLERTGSLRELLKGGGSQRDILQRAGSQKELVVSCGSQRELIQLGGSQRGFLQPSGSQQELTQRGGSTRGGKGSPLGSLFESPQIDCIKQDDSDETEYDEFAEETVVAEDTDTLVEESEYQHEFADDTEYGEQVSAISYGEETNSLTQQNLNLGASLTDDNDSEGEEELVTFLMRRIPRIKSKQERDSIAAFRLCRRRQSLDSLSTTSTARKKTTISSATQKSLQVSVHSTGSTALRGASLHSNSTTDSGYRSLDPEERQKLSGATGMMWVSDSVYEKQDNLLGNMDESEAGTDSDFDYLGSEPSRIDQQSKDIALSDRSCSQEELSGGSDTLHSSFATGIIEEDQEHVNRGDYAQRVQNMLDTKKAKNVHASSIKSDSGRSASDSSATPAISDYFRKQDHVAPEDSDFSNAPSTLSYLQDGHSSSGNLEKSPKASSSASAMTIEQKYFDKTTMKWKRRLSNVKEDAEVLEKTTGLASTVATVDSVHPMYFCKDDWKWKKRKLKEEKPPDGHPETSLDEPLNIPRMGMPFVDYISREDLKRRNRLLVTKCESTPLKIRATKELPFVTAPRDAAFRSAWKSVFDGETEHFSCLLCKKNARQVLMVPCRHLAICRNCSTKHKHLRACPLCDAPTSDRMVLS